MYGHMEAHMHVIRIVTLGRSTSGLGDCRDLLSYEQLSLTAMATRASLGLLHALCSPAMASRCLIMTLAWLIVNQVAEHGFPPVTMVPVTLALLG